MTNEESNTTENTSDDVKIVSNKTSDTIDKMAEGAKKAGEKAEVAIENIKEGTKKAGEKAGDVFGNIITGMKKVGDKASDAVEILEIKREISQLEDANKKIAPQISDTVLTLYAENKIKDSILTAFCEEIEKNNKLIEEKKAQIEVIKENEAE